MANAERKHAAFSQVLPEFEPYIPHINAAFREIWTPDDVDRMRKGFESGRASLPSVIPTEGFFVSHREIPVSDGSRVEIRIYRPVGEGKNHRLPLLFVLHGGGWVVGGHDSEKGMSQALCVKNKMAVISVDYRRAPEFQYPTPLNDAYDAYNWVREHAVELGIDENIVILGGMSAGANLVAALALKLREQNRLQGVVGQILNLPALCHPKFFPHDRYELHSYEQNWDAPTIDGAKMVWFWEQYYPHPERDALASPLLAESLRGLPPALIQVAGMDALRDEGIAYAEALRQDSVDTTIHVYSGVPHGFIIAADQEFTKRYFLSMVDWTAARLAAQKYSPSSIL